MCFSCNFWCTMTSSHKNISQYSNKMNITTRYSLIVLYSLAAVIIAVYLTRTLHKQPLTRWAMDDIDWTREWLLMTVLDYYGLVISLGLIVLFSEPFPMNILWILSFSLLGSPFACLYVIYRLAFKEIALTEISHATRDREHSYSRL